MRFHSSVLLGLLAANVSIAAKVGKFDADKCADPSGMKTCYDKAKSTYNECVKSKCDKDDNGKTTDDEDCLNQCGCTRDRAQIDCAASSCWNQVYSCEYQLTVSALIESCQKPDLDNVPFWPAPDNAPGGCSCSVGKVDKIATEASQILDKQCGIKSSDSSSKIEECMCCGFSAMLSSLPNTCPNTKPSELNLDGMEEVYEANGWKDCADTLGKVDCVKDFGYPKLDTYYKPGKVPGAGNASLSNTGSSSVTSPVSGATFTWTAGSSAHVVTAQSTDAAQATGSGASASATSGDSASGTASASATSTTGAAVRAGMDSYLWAGLAAVAVFVQA